MTEGKTIEFKQQYTEDIKYTVIAFANTEGGKIYIGIDDDGTVCGVHDAEETTLKLTNMIRDTIRPDVTLFTDCITEYMDNKPVIVMTVQRGTARPYYLYSKGVRPEGVYVRQGSSSIPASETAILTMIKETGGDYYEDARSVNQNLTFEKTQSYFSKKNLDFGDAQKRTLNIISQDGTFSNLGMLLSDQCTATIKMAVFEGSKKSVFRDRKELSGSLLQQIEDAYSYINQYNHIHSEINGLERIDKQDYPREALREALLNAIVHRDYSVRGSTLISIFDDRIEIVSIGGLVLGITYDDIMLGVSALRNQHLAQVFYRLRLIEAYGTGIMKINECYADYPVKPIIEVSNNAFKIILPNLNFTNQAYHTTTHTNTEDPRMETILALFSRKESIIRKDIDEALGVSQSTASMLLRKMLEKGLLKKVGNGRNTEYRKM